MDKIRIEDLHLRCIIGIFPEEREKKQDVLIQATLHTDLQRPGETDDVADTVDYKGIKNSIVELVESSEFLLIERMAASIAWICLADEKVERAEVRVDKPGALRFARTVSVEVERTREDLDRHLSRGGRPS
jgi:D-erythro-7,8-dihydroneopterin triphosphate epimerase